MRIGMAAIAAGVMVAATTVAAPAGAGEIPQRKMWADRYLSAVCPANAALDRTSREWEQFADGRRVVPFGTPVPSDLRRAYRHQSKVDARGGVKFARWDWPAQIAGPAQRMARGFYRDAEVAQKRAESRTVTRAWLQGWAKVGAAPRTMRVALGLPPANVPRDGC